MNLTYKVVLFVSLFLLITLGSCNNPPNESQNWLVVTKKQAEKTGMASWLVQSEGFWTPSDDDIHKLEENLVGYLSQNSSYFISQPPAWERLDEYQRQYVGLEREGRQIIYGNFFCDTMGMDWHETFVVVDDGGDCYFQIEFDVEDEMFIMLIVNGVS